MKEYSIERVSPFSGKIVTMVMTLDVKDYEAWRGGELIQEAMPYLTADERKFLMTGITPAEWDEMFR